MPDLYRVVYSATSHEYAVIDNGVVSWYGSMKSATRAHGDLPLQIVNSREFDAIRDGYRKATDVEARYWTKEGKVPGVPGPYRLVAGSGLWVFR